jgi:hypothetical protein
MFENACGGKAKLAARDNPEGIADGNLAIENF